MMAVTTPVVVARAIRDIGPAIASAITALAALGGIADQRAGNRADRTAEDRALDRIAGNCRTQALLATMLEVGADRILFSTDYPFEEMQEAADWIETATISETDRLKIARTNAAKLFSVT